MFQNLTPQQLITSYAANNTVLINVCDKAISASSLSWPILHIPYQEIPDRIAEIPTDKEVVFVCENGQAAGTISTFVKGYAYLANTSYLVGSIKELQRVNKAA